MTDEEKAERKWNEIAYKYTRIEDMACRIIKDDIVKAYLDGLAEGRKETAEKISEVEKENAELEEIRSGQVRIINNDTVRIERLKKEIAGLKTKYESYLRSHTITCGMTGEEIIEMRKENAELKAHCKAVDEMNEKMKNFQNCAHSSRALCPNGYKCSGCIDWELAE